MPTDTMTIDEGKLERFIGAVVGDLGATLNTALIRIGDKLGLYKAMAGAGPLTPEELAQRTDTAERYVREWLAAQAAGGYVAYDPQAQSYELPPEQAAALADEQSPFFLLGGFQMASAVLADEPKLADAFRSGEGFGWHEHDHRLFEGIERFFRPGYRGHLVGSWIPALEGVDAKLARRSQGRGRRLRPRRLDADHRRGLSRVDVRRLRLPRRLDRGRAQAPPRGRPPPSALSSRSQVRRTSRVRALIWSRFFDCLHDMGDPLGALAHVRETLDPDGAVMLVEPYAGDRLEDNLNPVGRVYYALRRCCARRGRSPRRSGWRSGPRPARRASARSLAEPASARFRRASRDAVQPGLRGAAVGWRRGLPRKTTGDARARNVEAFLDAAEWLLVEVGYSGITSRRARRPRRASTRASFTTTSARWTSSSSRCSSASPQLVARQREMYAAMCPSSRSGGRRWATSRRTLKPAIQKIWFELQAMAWSRRAASADRARVRGVAGRAHRRSGAGRSTSTGSIASDIPSRRWWRW